MDTTDFQITPEFRENIRNQIIGLDAPVTLKDGTQAPLINLDNSATTPSFKAVFDEVRKQLDYYGSIGRGKGQKSVHSTQIYENGRERVLRFFGATPEKYTAFYCTSASDGLNRLATALITDKSNLVLISRMEHHSNDLPWRHCGTPIYIDIDSQGRLKTEDVEHLLREHAGAVKFVSVTAASNVTGYVNDVHAIAEIAHRYGAQIVVDATQIVAHRRLSACGNTPEADLDYIVFSSHKMYAPFGGGAVVGKLSHLQKCLPHFYGGGIVDVVSDWTETYLSAPERYEVGSPNYVGVVAMLKTMDILDAYGFDAIEEHEQRLLKYAIDGLRKIPGLKLYADCENISDRIGVLVFNLEGILHSDVAQQLAEMRGIAVRQGSFCSHPYVCRLLGICDETITECMCRSDFSLPGMVRVSFGIYNDESDVDALLSCLKKISAATQTLRQS